MTPHIDFRGFLSRTYDREVFEYFGIDRRWKQESWSYTRKRFTLRGLHAQLQPHTETKLISLIRGQMKWVVVDLRKGSDTFGQWEATILSEEQHNALFVSAGFAHGCLSLSDHCDLIIKSDREFTEDHGVGIAWNDPALGIEWGEGGISPLLSERDRQNPPFENFLMKHDGL